MAAASISDSELLSALTGSKSAPSTPPPPKYTAAPEVSDDEILHALTGTKPKPAVSSDPSTWKNKVGGISTTSPQPSMLERAYNAYSGFNQDIGKGATQGLRDVASSFDPVAQYLDKHIGQVTLGGLLPTADQAHANNLSARNAFDASNPNMIQQGGRLAGQGIGAGAAIEALGLPGMTAAGPAGASTLLKLLMRGGQGAVLGGEGALATSGASDQPIGEQVESGAGLGATIGAGVPLAIMSGTTARRGIGNALAPFTETGRDSAAQRLARGVIEDFSGGPVQPNASELVPGSKPTLAEATGNPGVAGLQRALQNLNPNSPLIARAEENNAARSALFDAASGSPEVLDKAIRARDAAAGMQLKQIFSKGNADRTDVAPVRATVENILAGPDGNRPAVKSAMNDVLSMMSRDGKPINDPETLYNSVRKGIDDLISGKDLTKGYGAQSARELLTVKDALDNAIESGAPGFKKYLQDYAASSAPITSMKFLQSLNLTDAKGNITLAKVQTAINRLDDQLAAPGVKAGKAVTTIQRQALESIRDDLLRQANIAKGLPINSSTVQNAINQQRLGLAAHVTPATVAELGAGLGGGIGALHSMEGAALGGTAGATLGGLIGKGLPDVNALMRAAMQHHLEDMVLNPESYARAAPQANAPSGVINLLASRPGSHVIPLAVMGKNRLMNHR